MSSSTSASPPQRRIRRQRLSLRLGLEPYYALIEHTPTRLVLQSQPDANATTGRIYMGCATAIALLNPLIIFGIFFSGAQTMGALVFGIILAWPFAAIGWLGIRIGRAIATTINTVTVDGDARTIVYTQANRVNRLRSQTLHFDQVARLRLRPHWVKPPGLFRRHRQTIALEMITDEGFTWLVDSAADPSVLMPTATTFAEMLGIPLSIDPTS